MNRAERKRLYREAVRYTRWRPTHRFVRFESGPGKITGGRFGNGHTLSFASATVTIGGPRRQSHRPPLVEPRGPVTTTWDV